jgi:integrase/recombinase XerD
MIASPSAPAMRCEVAEFDSRGLPLRLRWIQPQTALLGARERGIVLAAIPESIADRDPKAIDEWKAYLKDHFHGETGQAYAWWVRKFFVWCQARGIRLADVRQNTVEAFLTEVRERYKPNSLRACFRALAVFFEWAAEHGVENPTTKIRKPKSQSGVHLKDDITDGEMIALLATCSEDPIGRRDRAMFCLMYYCGMRSGEVRHADLGDIETRDSRKILWILGKGHSGKDQFKVIPEVAETALREWLAVRPGSPTGPIFTVLDKKRTLHTARRIGANRIRIIVHRRLLSIGINSPRKTAHSLRHGGASNALRHGATLLQVMAMLGHADPRTTMIYIHQSDRLRHPAEDFVSITHGTKEKETDDHKTTSAD